MDKPIPLEELKEKYIQISRQYLDQLHHGKSADQLTDLLHAIQSLGRQIDELEKQG